ncbi:MAG: DUF4349 domain-containing protein [Actinobacteria bacterium]|nr:MAG: DUF4349 domain-containing protein [Actinomycetota bacterium]
MSPVNRGFTRHPRHSAVDGWARVAPTGMPVRTPAPGQVERGVQRMLRAAAGTDPGLRPGRPGRPRSSQRGLGISVLIALAGLVVTAALVSSWSSHGGGGRSATKGSAIVSPAPAGGAAPTADRASSGSVAALALPAQGPPGAGAVTQSGEAPRVVKTGNVQLEVAKGRFEPAMAHLTDLAAGSGGFVAATQASETGSSPAGSVTLRVPEPSFEAVLNQVRALGKVDSVSTQGQDVTAQYVDLQARIDALEAARQRHLAILAKASAIGDILAVQQQIDGLQSQLEQLQGQQKVLDDQTRYGTLTVAVAESGGRGPALPPARSAWGRAWHRASGEFVAGVQGLIGVSGGLGFAALCLAAMGGLGLLVSRRLRRGLV